MSLGCLVSGVLVSALATTIVIDIDVEDKIVLHEV